MVASSQKGLGGVPGKGEAKVFMAIKLLNLLIGPEINDICLDTVSKGTKEAAVWGDFGEVYWVVEAHHLFALQRVQITDFHSLIVASTKQVNLR